MSFVHEDPDFPQLLAIVSRETGVAAALVEKDYWVTHCLWALHEDRRVDSGEPRMKRRLRKKKRLGEFKELGFEVRADLRSDLAVADIEAFVDRLIDVVEARTLAVGGGCARDGKFEGLVTRAGRDSATDDDRQALDAFLEGDAAIVRHEVGERCDEWYVSEEPHERRADRPHPPCLRRSAGQVQASRGRGSRRSP